MTKQYFPFDNAQVMEAQWTLMARQWVQSGVFSGIMNEMLVYGDSTGMQVKVKTGGGWVQGHYYSNDAEETLAIQAAHATLNRIDRVILYVDWTNNLVNTSVVTGTPAASPAAPTLTQNTSIWQISLAQVYVGAAVATITAGNVTDERPFAVNATPDGVQLNNSGGALGVGTVVVRDVSVNLGFKTAAKVGDPSVCGVVTQAIGSGARTRLQKNGCWPVLCTGTIVAGHWLVTSATPGYAQDSGSIQRPTIGGIGIALVGQASGTGLVLTDVDINVYTSSVVLQQLPTTTQFTGTGSAITTAHTTDTGTDLLIVRLFTYDSNRVNPTSVTFNGVGLTSAGSQYYGTYQQGSIWYLRNPPIGTYNLVVNTSASIASDLIVTNYVGSQPTPLRAFVSTSGASVTTISLTPTSAVGDIVIDNLGVNLSGWTVSSGQTTEVANRAVGANGYHSVSNKVGGAGSTTMSYGGGSAAMCFMAVAIAGS